MTTDPSPVPLVLITGASRGLGLAMARAFAAPGTRLGLIARSADRLETVRAELSKDGAHVRAWAGDVTDHAFMSGVVTEAERDLGPIEVLINNAGEIGPIGPLADVAHEAWWQMGRA